MTRIESPLATEMVRRLLDDWPHPLPQVLRRYWESRVPGEDGRPTSDPNVFSLLDLAGTLLRFLSLILLAEYLQRHRDQRLPDSDLNRLILNTLQTPADGNWLKLSRRLSEVLGPVAGDLLVPGLVGREEPVVPEGPLSDLVPPGLLQREKGRNRTVALDRWDVFEWLNRYRNHFFHGAGGSVAGDSSAGAATDDDADGGEDEGGIVDVDLQRAAWLLEHVVRDLEPLSRLVIGVREPSGGTLLCRGIVVEAFPRDESVNVPTDFEVGVPFLPDPRGGRPTELWPFLIYVDSEDTPVLRLSELCFFSRADTRSVEYAVFRDPGRWSSLELGSAGHSAYRNFVRLISSVESNATPEVLPPPGFDDRELFDELLRYFVGRGGELQRIVGWLHETPSGYGALTGRAGSGKSAILARLHEIAAGEADGAPVDIGPIRFVWHFCQRRDGRNDQIQILRSLCHQIQETCSECIGRARDVPKTLAELRQRIGALLEEVSEHNLRAANPFKLAIVLDALDEATPYAGAADLLLPNFPDPLPPGVLVLASYRVHENGRPVLNLGDRGVRIQQLLPEALPPLGRDAVEELLRTLMGRRNRAVDDDLVETILQRSTGDPLYLYFLAHGIDTGQIDLENPEQVPAGLGSFFRRRLWNRLPHDDDFAAHRLLALLAALRFPCSDPFAASILEVPEVVVAAARRHFGSFLNYGASDDGQVTYLLYHDRLEQYVEGEFAPEERAALHGRLIESLSRDLPKSDETESPGPPGVRAYDQLSFHRFERGRNLGDFTELFAAYDAGYVDEKLHRLADPSATEEDYALLLRACRMADDLPRAFRAGLERSTISSEVQWLTTRGLPGLLARMASVLGPRYLATLRGAVDLIEDEADRMEALVEIATCLEDPVAAQRLAAEIVTSLQGSGPELRSRGWVGHLIGMVGQRMPDLWSEVDDLVRTIGRNSVNQSDELGTWLPRWSEVPTGIPESWLTAVSDAANAVEVTRHGASPMADQNASALFQLMDKQDDLGANALLRHVAPNGVAQLLEPLLWSEVRPEQWPLVQTLGEQIRRAEIPSPTMHLIEARHLAARGDWRGVAAAFDASLDAFRAAGVNSHLARIAMVMCELDRPGSPMIPDEDAPGAGAKESGFREIGSRAALQLLQVAASQVRVGEETDMRGKRGTEMVISMEGTDLSSGGRAEIAAFTAAANASMGVLGPARAKFGEAVQLLERAPLSCWRADLPALLRAALRFPDPRERAARIFDVLHTVESVAGGLLLLSQLGPASRIAELLPVICDSLPGDLARSVVRRCAETARSLASDEARVRLLTACADRMWALGDRPAAFDLTRETCLALAFRDRLTLGVSGFRAARALAEQSSGDVHVLLAETLCKLAEADPRHTSFVPLAQALVSVLPDVSDPDRRSSLMTRLQRVLTAASFRTAPRELVENLTDVATHTFDRETAVEVLTLFLHHYAVSDAEDHSGWLECLFAAAWRGRFESVCDRLIADAVAIERADYRNTACCHIAEIMLDEPDGRDVSTQVARLLEAAEATREEFDVGIREHLERVGGMVGMAPDTMEQWMGGGADDEDGDSAEPGRGGTKTTIASLLNQLVGKQLKRSRSGFDNAFIEAGVRMARLHIRTGDVDRAIPLLRTAVERVEQLIDSDGDLARLFEELSTTASACAEPCSGLGEELVGILDDVLLESSRYDWVSRGCLLAGTLIALGREDEGRALLEQRVTLAETEAFPYSEFGKLASALESQSPTVGSHRAERLFEAVVGWRDEHIKEAGPEAAGAIRYDVDKAMFLANRSEESNRLEANLALADALEGCPPDWVRYASYRLIEHAMKTPRDALLAVLTALCRNVPSQRAETNRNGDDPRRLADIVLGRLGYGLLDDSGAVSTADTIS